MWIENKIFHEDLEYINDVDYIPWDCLNGKTVFITGATGLIGYYVASALLYRNIKYNSSIKVMALVRNFAKAEAMFKAQLQEDCGLQFIEGSVESLPYISEHVDYIIHGASPTASKYFVEHPVETIQTAVLGTMNMLELSKEKQGKGFVYLSSMEVYGAPHTDDPIAETQGTTVDTMSVRSCYPEAKRMCEAMCASYSAEYGVPAMALRLAQTFGPGVNLADNRVFAEFARCAMQGKDIVLQTAGTSKRCYLYNADAVTAILTVLLKGDAGEAYNAANQSTYCSIVEMAEMVAKEIGHGSIEVHVPSNGTHNKKYPPDHNLFLSIRKLGSLNWKAVVDLKGMYLRMIG